MAEPELPIELADLVVLATDLRDAGRELIKRADMLYEETIVVALRLQSSPVAWPEVPEELSQPVSAHEEEQI